MCYPDMENYIKFQFQLLEEFDESIQPNQKKKGRPKAYSDASMIVFFAIMTLKGFNEFRAQHRWLLAHPLWILKLKLPKLPSRRTISRRYKDVYSKLVSFVTFVGDWATPLGSDFNMERVYEDKSLFKAKGPVWHKKDREANRVPKDLRNLDQEATWSKSGYHGWVYGYGLHTTVTEAGFPLMVRVETAAVSEKAVLDQKKEKLLERNIGYLVADDGYTDLTRTEELAKKGLLLMTPAIGATSRKGRCYIQYTTQPLLESVLSKRKTAVEPIFDLIKRLLSTSNNHKQLPVRGQANVATFLALGVVILQFAMLINSIWGLPLRNVTHIITLFR